MENEKVIDWIKDVRLGCKKIIEKDTAKLMGMLKKGNLDNDKYALLFEELRDNERDDALLSLIQKMLEEEKLNKSQTSEAGTK